MLSVPSFVSQASALIPVIFHRLSGDPNEPIFISLSNQQSVIVSIEKFDANCITLKSFLAMLDGRMRAEFAYQGEIMELRNNLCNKFYKLCDGATDENFIKLMKDQRQRIINAVFDETKIEKKIIAEHFFYNMMNGCDEKILDLYEFSKLVCSILWKPLMTPFPIGALDMMEELINKLGNKISGPKIEEMVSQFITYIKDALRVKEIRDSNFKTRKGLKKKLENLANKRQICKIVISNLTKTESIVEQFKGICIKKIKIQVNSTHFLESHTKINFDNLDLLKPIGERNFEKLFDKINRQVASLNIRLDKGNYQLFSKYFPNLILLKDLKLHLRGNNIGDEEIKTISTALKELKSISSLNLDLTDNKIGIEGAKAILTALKELKSISTLDLNFAQNYIKDETAKAISVKLKALKNISVLGLNLDNNYIGGKGAKALFECFGELENISVLALRFYSNSIGDEGIKEISTALEKLKHISALTLVFGDNNIGKEGAIAVSAALEKLKNISTLSLYFQPNNIGSDGAISIIIALYIMEFNFSRLELNLQQNNYGVQVKKALEDLKFRYPHYQIYVY